MHVNCQLLQDLPTVQFLITCSICSNRGGRPAFYHVIDVNINVGRQRGGGSPINILCTRFPLEQGRFLGFWTLKLQCLGQKLQEKASSLFFQLGTPSPSVYLDRHWRHSRDRIGPGLPPVRFCKLHMYKWSKTGQWEGLGTRLSKAYHHTICWENRW